MALNIRSAEADRLARELSATTGERLTEAVVAALRERLQRQRKRRPIPTTAREILREAQVRLSRLPVLDWRATDEILSYDAKGLPR